MAILQKEIRTESDSRNQMCNLLQIWDDNKNGIWDPEEIEAYNNEVCLVHQHLEFDKPKRQWYILQDGFVFGPTSLPESFENTEALISFGGQTRWVRLKDAQLKVTFSVDEPPKIPVADEQIG